MMSDLVRRDDNAFLSELEMLSLKRYDGPWSSGWWISSLIDLIYVSRAGSLLVGGVHLDFLLKGFIVSLMVSSGS